MTNENKMTKKLISKNGYYSEKYLVENIPDGMTDDKLLNYCGAIFGGYVERYRDDSATVNCYMD